MDIIRGEDLVKYLDEVVERATDERLIISHAGKQVALVLRHSLIFGC